MTRLPIVSAKTMETLLTRLGFQAVRQKGSHVFYRHEETDGDFALVRTESSKPILASVIGAKSVTWKGRVQRLE